MHLSVSVTLFLAFFCLLGSTLASEGNVKGQIEAQETGGRNDGLSAEILNDISVQLVGESGTYNTFVRPDGSFEFHQVEAGSYALHVHSLHLLFPHFRVDVSKRTGAIRVQTFSKGPVKHPVTVRPVGQAVYFQPHQGINMMGMLANPMVIMMAVSFGLMFVLPKMMESMDPEELKRVQADMGSSPINKLLNAKN